MKERRAFSDFVYRNRLLGKRVVSFLNHRLPRSLSRPITSFAEKVAFWMTPQYQGDTLPSIFHYWSHRYLRPSLARFGFESPEDFYLKQTMAYATKHARPEPLSILSLGSGAADLELRLMQKLSQSGVRSQLECVDFNTKLRDIANNAAEKMGLAERFVFTVRDCNNLEPTGRYDIIIVNQFFHHVENLDAFCVAIKGQLKPEGALLTSDVVGRNGHVLWPTVDRYVQSTWSELQPAKRFDRHFGSQRVSYTSVDHSSYSNEGIRAQEVVRKLMQHFDFEVFMTYGARIMPFIERRVGFNFPSQGLNHRL